MTEDEVIESAQAFIERMETKKLTQTEVAYIGIVFIRHIRDELAVMESILTKIGMKGVKRQPIQNRKEGWRTYGFSGQDV